jgi:hypothetical protein
LESVVDLLPSTFTASSIYPGYYEKTFSFDRSFSPLRTFTENELLHILKVHIVFDCVECVYSTNSFSRTLFLIKDETSQLSQIATFNVENGLPCTITIAGTTSASVVLTANNVENPVTVVDAILAGIGTLTGYSFTKYSPGVLQITRGFGYEPVSITITSSKGVSVSLGSKANYKTVQYPYLPLITDYSYMNNFVLKEGVSPEEIKPGDSTTPYVDISISFDIYSLSPSNLDFIDLGSGIIRIPIKLTSHTDKYYINFAEDATILDEKVKIQIIAQPVNQDNLSLYYPSNIVQLTQNSLSLVNLEDINLEVTV